MNARRHTYAAHHRHDPSPGVIVEYHDCGSALSSRDVGLPRPLTERAATAMMVLQASAFGIYHGKDWVR